jgi:serine/threonine-protein kinase
LISHFRIVNILGTGGMGKVFKATDINTKKEVALKVINPELLKDPENKKRFGVEGRILSSIQHENIVKVFEYGDSEESSYIAMELLEGGTLKNLLDKNFPIDEVQIKNILLQICSGLKKIHSEKIIHRDIKTNNIMFDTAGRLRLMDFGLSKSTLVSTMTTLGTVIGTLGYVAPEQITNTNVDERTDIFSLGVVLYELATNVLPFNGENEIALIHSIFNTTPAIPSAYNPKISNRLDNIIMKCLSRDSAKRYSTIDELLADLSGVE